MNPDEARRLHDDKLLRKLQCCRKPDISDLLWCSEKNEACPPEMCHLKDGGKCEFQVFKKFCKNCEIMWEE